jgi:hypothetical protein
VTSAKVRRPIKDCDPDTAADQIAMLLEAIFSDMARVVDRVIEVHRAAAERGEDFTGQDLAAVRPLILEQLHSRSFTDGLGVVTATDLVAHHSRYIEWWRRDGAEVAPLVLNFDPSSVDIYDYLEMEWFVRAQCDNRRTVFGPYVDYAGADHYVLTLAAPIVDGHFLGIVGADVRMEFFEPELLNVLQDLDEPAILVNSERRVVAATSHDATVGARLAMMPHVGDRGVLAAVPVGADSGWVLALMETTDADTEDAAE